MISSYFASIGRWACSHRGLPPPAKQTEESYAELYPLKEDHYDF